MDPDFQCDLARFGPEAVYTLPSLSLSRAYCAALTKRHYENFTVVSYLLPRKLVPHFQAVYAYCRWSDDLGDETGSAAPRLLAWWRRELDGCFQGYVRHPVFVALRDTVVRFGIPKEPFANLLTAFEQDQRVKRYETFAELLEYCRNSANPVGRLVLHLCESYTDENARLSDSICTGLQLANFWQDAERDWSNLGRVYIPQEDIWRFGVAERDIAEKRFTNEFKELMRFQVQRAKGFLEAGRLLIPHLKGRLRVDIELFRLGGLAILKKIEECGYDVLTERPRLSKFEKAFLTVQALRNAIR